MPSYKTHKAEYQAWIDMRRRCQNPKNAAYQWYGGRGIRVCEAWNISFEAFLSCVGLRPGPGYSLDRIKTDGNYEDGNVKWSSRSEQQNNKRNTWVIRYNGEVMPAAYARKMSSAGVNKNHVRDRINRGWSVEDAVNVPPGQRVGKRPPQKIVFDGEELTIAEAIQKVGSGIAISTIYQRMRRNGWSLEKAITEPVKVQMRR